MHRASPSAVQPCSCEIIKTHLPTPATHAVLCASRSLMLVFKKHPCWKASMAAWQGGWHHAPQSCGDTSRSTAPLEDRTLRCSPCGRPRAASARGTAGASLCFGRVRMRCTALAGKATGEPCPSMHCCKLATHTAARTHTARQLRRLHALMETTAKFYRTAWSLSHAGRALGLSRPQRFPSLDTWGQSRAVFQCQPSSAQINHKRNDSSERAA